MPTLVSDYIYLLECTIATYDGLCGVKNKRKGELARHEQIILKHVSSGRLDFADELKLVSKFSLMVPRVREVFSYIANGDTPEAACQRYFLRVRYGKGE